MGRKTMSKVLFVIIGLHLITLGCGSNNIIKLTKHGKLVKTDNTVPISKYNCKKVGDLYSEHAGEVAKLRDIITNARNKLKNQSAAKKGNFIRIDSSHTIPSEGSKVLIAFMATSFKCSPIGYKSRQIIHKNNQNQKAQAQAQGQEVSSKEEEDKVKNDQEIKQE